MAVAVASAALERVVRDALAEDVGGGDVTTEALFEASAVGIAELLVKERGVLCGLAAAETVFRFLDDGVEFEPLARDGDLVEPSPVARVQGRLRALLTGERAALNLLGRLSGVATLTRRYADAVAGTGARILDTRKTTPGLRELDPSVAFEATTEDGAVTEGEVARVAGDARALLTGERTALNLLGRLSGVATLTRAYVDAVAGTGATILDTRKTTPGLRALEKLAVRTGGGTNHRFGLYDGILIKDNHLRLGGGVARSVRAAQGQGVPVEVECETLDDVREALAAQADVILLDNMTPPELRAAVRLVAGPAKTEASGGVTLETVRAIAETGVDFVSVGALTHSARSLDVSMEVR